MSKRAVPGDLHPIAAQACFRFPCVAGEAARQG